MIVVSGHFRLPPGRTAEARGAIRTVIAASLAEQGCRAYSYAKDVNEPGLFRVHEEWDSRAALEANFAAAPMREWQEARDALGFHDRSHYGARSGGSQRACLEAVIPFLRSLGRQPTVSLWTFDRGRRRPDFLG